jgi:CheY-like chemotaxis protein/DNA-directed RNA polymerase specialized sigma24 family protein
MTVNRAGVLAEIDNDVRYLRRYARALTGSQATGDRYALVSLEAAVAEPSVLEAGSTPKVALFHLLHTVWQSSGGPLGEADDPLAARAQRHMAGLTPQTREALLLHSIEGFSAAQIGEIMDIEAGEAENLVAIAQREMLDALAGQVMVIEDDAIIAMDIRSIVEGMGHRVTGVARTRSEAVDLANHERPDLILSDIELADHSSGIDAVNDIVAHFPETPVIFITGYPERLLTGRMPEPAFLIAKPFSEDQVRSAVSQAMFFASTETLAGR